MKKVYKKLGYKILIVPKNSIKERIKFILKRI
jgi:predicted ATPase